MSATDEPFIIGIPIYEGVDLLDICAPCEIFSWMGEVWQGLGGRAVSVVLTAKTKDTISTRASKPPGPPNAVRILPHKTFAELPRLDLLFVPGGSLDGLVAAGNDSDYLDFLKTRSVDADWVTSVCEGALLLAHADLLNGREATTHWAFKKCLSQFPQIAMVEGYPRHVVCGDRVTGGGISAGLDECMKLIELIVGPDDGPKVAADVRRKIQYFPKPVKQDLPDAPPCPIGEVYPDWPKHAPCS